MSGRGVMTSRTRVPPKSTIDCSSARSSRSIRFVLLRRLGAVGGLGLRSSALGAGGRVLALAPAVDDQAHERPGQRVEEARGEIERRQQELEHLLGVAPDDEQRQHVLEEQDEHRDEQQQHRRSTRSPPSR